MGLFFKKRNVKPIFVGSYGNNMTRGMYVFHLDIDNGEILKKKFYKSLANPTALFKRERFIYVIRIIQEKRLMVDYGNMQQWIYSLV